jgi:hypothetical protein
MDALRRSIAAEQDNAGAAGKAEKGAGKAKAEKPDSKVEASKAATGRAKPKPPAPARRTAAKASPKLKKAS